MQVNEEKGTKNDAPPQGCSSYVTKVPQFNCDAGLTDTAGEYYPIHVLFLRARCLNYDKVLSKQPFATPYLTRIFIELLYTIDIYTVSIEDGELLNVWKLAIQFLNQAYITHLNRRLLGLLQKSTIVTWFQEVELSLIKIGNMACEFDQKEILDEVCLQLMKVSIDENAYINMSPQLKDKLLRKSLKIASLPMEQVEAKDSQGFWYVANVLKKQDNLWTVHYCGWSAHFDDIFQNSSERIAPIGTRDVKNTRLGKNQEMIIELCKNPKNTCP